MEEQEKEEKEQKNEKKREKRLPFPLQFLFTRRDYMRLKTTFSQKTS